MISSIGSNVPIIKSGLYLQYSFKRMGSMEYILCEYERMCTVLGGTTKNIYPPTPFTQHSFSFFTMLYTTYNKTYKKIEGGSEDLLFSFLKFTTKFNPAYRPLDSTVTEDAGIEPCTVATFALKFPHALTTQLHGSHPQKLTTLHGESCSCLTHDLYTATHNHVHTGTPSPSSTHHTTSREMMSTPGYGDLGRFVFNFQISKIVPPPPPRFHLRHIHIYSCMHEYVYPGHNSILLTY
jgi:hypothetical protein